MKNTMCGSWGRADTDELRRAPAPREPCATDTTAIKPVAIKPTTVAVIIPACAMPSGPSAQAIEL